jgi:hypothetical protein
MALGATGPGATGPGATGLGERVPVAFAGVVAAWEESAATLAMPMAATRPNMVEAPRPAATTRAPAAG